jgi:predicted RNase H-like nuclease (RuvC/YqgF family)
VEDSKYEVGRKLTVTRELVERNVAALDKARETIARLLREQKDDRDHIRMQGDAIVRLTQELADERQAVSILLRRIDSERPYPE